MIGTSIVRRMWELVLSPVTKITPCTSAVILKFQSQEFSPPDYMRRRRNPSDYLALSEKAKMAGFLRMMAKTVGHIMPGAVPETLHKSGDATKFLPGWCYLGYD